MKSPKILVFDIETAPIAAHVWRLWKNDSIGLNQVVSDWHLLSWSAKWLSPGPYSPSTKGVFYQDQRNSRCVSYDKPLLIKIWKLLDEADIVLTQNGKSFDSRKLNAKFLEHGFQPPSSYRHIDTKILAQKHFDFTSYKLEYMTGKFNTKYKKLKHKKFPGHEMWTECLKGNKEAWKCMEKYNKYDVLALEELYHVLAPWGTGINFSVYNEGETVCQCGGTSFKQNGHYYTNSSKVNRYRCVRCGNEFKDKTNLISKEAKKKMKVTSR